MTDKFGQFSWNCYKDKQPELNRFVYVYFIGEHGIDVGLAKDYAWDDDMYWSYVFIPDKPVINKEISVEDRIENLNCVIAQMMVSHDRLLDRVSKLELRK